MAVLGELDGIADEVEQDLSDLAGVAAQGGRKLAVERQPEVEPLFGGHRAHEGDNAADQLAEVEIDLVERDIARLDLGVVEDGVEDAEQGLAGTGRDRQVLALLWPQLGVGEQAHHAQHAGHRRTDFVAHRRQEC